MSEYQSILYEYFLNPPVEYRSVPFWSLNDKLDPVEIKRQLREFRKGGYGGAYLHSRIGLLTQYLGEDWWKAIDAGVEACKEEGIEAWFYDEDKWPSGFAGGMVPLMDEDFHARCLMRLDKKGKLPDNAEILAEDENYVYFCYKVKMGNPWFNGTCWVDLLNPDMVKSFIDCSYRPYSERYAEDTGNAVKGIFTDEPQVSPKDDSIQHKGVLSYSTCLREEFKKQHGYDIIDYVACLFENTGNYKKVRLDYYRTLALQFEKSFSKQIGEYCEQNGLIWTGHYNGEEHFLSVLQNVGNMMIQYRHMQRPGIDHLGLRIRGGLNAAKSLSSVANQYGKDRRLSELFGISGQNMSFEDRKWIADWHAALGINHFCPHLALYSMKGCRKRDYPPTLSPQQPYWKYNKILEDYMARVCYLSSCGRYAAELLVIHPLESAYIEYNGMDSFQSIMDVFNSYYRVLEMLQSSHRNYDLGDECIISDIAKVKDGYFNIGKMNYKAVLLPFMKTIRRKTLELLFEFAESGGFVLAVGNYPETVDGEMDNEALAKLKSIADLVTMDGLTQVLSGKLPPAVRIEGVGSEEVYIHQRWYDDGQILQLSNTSRLQKAECKVYLSCNIENPLLWDPATGKCFALVGNEEGAFEIHLAPAQTLFLTTAAPSLSARVDGEYQIPRCEETVKAIDGVWHGKRMDPNAITLDFAKYSTDGGKTFSKPEPIIGIHERLTAQGYCGELRLLFEFESDVVPKNCNLVIEQPKMYSSIEINGQVLDFVDTAFYVDHSFRTTGITSHLKKGTNTILLVLNYIAPVPDSLDAVTRYGTEIESIYLIGDFGVKAKASKYSPGNTQKNMDRTLPSQNIHRISSFVLSDEKEFFKGDLTVQGYPFYSGSFLLKQDFYIDRLDKDARCFIRFPKVESIVVECELNGIKLEPVAWSPWEIEVTSCLKAGDNHIELTLTNSLRNLLGPHHHCQGELIEVGPVSFTGRSSWPDQVKGKDNWYDLRIEGKANKWHDDYYLIPFGLLESPVIIMKN